MYENVQVEYKNSVVLRFIKNSKAQIQYQRNQISKRSQPRRHPRWVSGTLCARSARWLAPRCARSRRRSRSPPLLLPHCQPLRACRNRSARGDTRRRWTSSAARALVRRIRPQWGGWLHRVVGPARQEWIERPALRRGSASLWAAPHYILTRRSRRNSGRQDRRLGRERIRQTVRARQHC